MDDADVLITLIEQAIGPAAGTELGDRLQAVRAAQTAAEWDAPRTPSAIDIAIE